MLLDTTYNFETPEGVELRLPVAGLASRSLAWLVDALIKLAIFVVISIFFELLGDFGAGATFLTMFFLLWFYNVLFEVMNHGATPGKHALDLRVMNINGTPVSWSGSLIRNLLRFVDSLPGCYAFGCASVLVSKNFQRIGDLAAGTIVVHQTKPMASSKLNDAEPAALGVPLSLDEQQAIVSFGERAESLNSERAEELAAILKPMLGDVNKEQLCSYANGLIGGRRSS